MPWIFNNDITSADRTASYKGNILTISFHNMKQASYSPYYNIQFGKILKWYDLLEVLPYHLSRMI